MEIRNKSALGHYYLSIEEGVLVLTELSSEALVQIRSRGSYFGFRFLLNASYEIDNGTLYIRGDYHIMEHIDDNSNSLGWRDFRGSAEDLVKFRSRLWIGDEAVYESPRKRWFQEIGTWVHIKHNHYLRLLGSPASYKTSLFRIR